MIIISKISLKIKNILYINIFLFITIKKNVKTKEQYIKKNPNK